MGVVEMENLYHRTKVLPAWVHPITKKVHQTVFRDSAVFSYTECFKAAMSAAKIGADTQKKLLDRVNRLAGNHRWPYLNAIDEALKEHFGTAVPIVSAIKTAPNTQKVEVKTIMKAKAPDVEIVELTMAKVKSAGIDFREAMALVMKENPALAEAYKAELGVR
jgi:hypothetical protein